MKNNFRGFLKLIGTSTAWITSISTSVKPGFFSFRGYNLLRIVLIVACIYSNSDAQNRLALKDFTVLDKPAEDMMRTYLTNLVDKQFAARDSLLSTLKFPTDWDRRAQTIRDSLASWTGLFPKRTPLHARITGRIEREDYLIEKVMFDSRPNFPVSASLYIPKNIIFPRPAILNVIGHSISGKARDKVQMRSIDQVKKEFIVLTIDGIGQGERKVEDYGTSSPGSAHKVLGLQSFLSGTHLFNFMAWDVIRAIDYLVSRREVDASRIGVTGSSGGGMMSTYILPFEDRIAVAVPVCNPNTWSHRVHANLGTDEEQVFLGAFAGLIDPRGDPLFVFAQSKKPLLLNTTTDDHLNPPRGVWDLSTWLFKAYSAHGVPEKLSTTMVKAGHAYNKGQREITNAWMLRWTGGDASKFIENTSDTSYIEESRNLWATPEGNVYNLPNSREPWELILNYLEEHEAEWETPKGQEALNDRKPKIKTIVKKTLKINSYNLDEINIKSDLKKTQQVGDVEVRKFTLSPEKGIVLPGVLLSSKDYKIRKPRQDVILYISQNGKSDIFQSEKTLKDLLRKGYVVCAVDLRGTGETAPDMQAKLWDILVGKPIFGQRVRDVLATIKWLSGPAVNAKNITLWGKGLGALYGTFAGVFSDRISNYVLENPLLSFESVVQTKVPKYGDELLIPNILKKFDMPQIYQAVCPTPVTVINPYRADKTVADSMAVEKEYESVSEVYESVNKQSHWNPELITKGEKNSLILKSLIN